MEPDTMTSKHIIIIVVTTIIISASIVCYMRPGSSTISGSLADDSRRGGNNTISGTLPDAPKELTYFFADIWLMSETQPAKNMLADIFKLNSFHLMPESRQFAIITAIMPDFGTLTVYDRPKALGMLKKKFAHWKQNRKPR